MVVMRTVGDIDCDLKAAEGVDTTSSVQIRKVGDLAGNGENHGTGRVADGVMYQSL
jgi:hypothetical protein